MDAVPPAGGDSFATRVPSDLAEPNDFDSNASQVDTDSSVDHKLIDLEDYDDEEESCEFETESSQFATAAESTEEESALLSSALDEHSYSMKSGQDSVASESDHAQCNGLENAEVEPNPRGSQPVTAELNLSNHNAAVEVVGDNASQNVSNHNNANGGANQDQGGASRGPVSRIPVKTGGACAGSSGMRAVEPVSANQKPASAEEEVEIFPTDPNFSVKSHQAQSPQAMRSAEQAALNISGVRNSKSHENYLESNKSGMQCVDIDFEEEFATSVDALHYEQNAGGGASVAAGAERQVKSLSSSPEKQDSDSKPLVVGNKPQSQPQPHAEKVLMPTFISLEEPKKGRDAARGKGRAEGRVSPGGVSPSSGGPSPRRGAAGSRSPRSAPPASEGIIFLQDPGESSTDPVEKASSSARSSGGFSIDPDDDGVWVSRGALEEALSQAATPQHSQDTTAVEINQPRVASRAQDPAYESPTRHQEPESSAAQDLAVESADQVEEVLSVETHALMVSSGGSEGHVSGDGSGSDHERSPTGEAACTLKLVSVLFSLITEKDNGRLNALLESEVVHGKTQKESFPTCQGHLPSCGLVQNFLHKCFVGNAPLLHFRVKQET